MRRGRKRPIVFLLSFIAFLLFALLIVCIYFGINTKFGPGEAIIIEQDGTVTYSQAQVDEIKQQALDEGKKSVLDNLKNSIENGQSIISILKGFYPDYLVVGSSGTYHWVEINDSLQKNDYNVDNLIVDEDTGIYAYDDQDKYISKKGIDVSSHQGDIDWAAVKDDGVEFAFIRALYRGYGNGAIVIDEKCIENIEAAQAVGIDVGVYVFSQAITEDEAIEEASTVMTLISDQKLDLPIVYDVEKVASGSARMNKLSVEERTNVALAFLNTIEEAGQDSMIYYNTEMGALLIDIAKLEGYKKWFAGYNKEFYWPYDYQFWQYSENGKIDGIKGKVDLDLWITKK